MRLHPSTPPKSPPFWRFLAIAAAIVSIVGAVLFAHPLGRPDLRVSAKPVGTPTPTVEGPGAARASTPGPAFAGQGSWVMSSLPACFVESEVKRGSLVDERLAIPPAAQRLASGTVLRRGGCTVAVRAHDIWISRGNDRLRVPPEAALYAQGSTLTLVVRNGNRVEIRTY